MWNIEKIKKAWQWATKAHDGQTYGGTLPGEKINYLSHIGSVFMEVSWSLSQQKNRNGELALLCAILHDTIEDTNLTYNTIEEGFGKEVADGVMALTKNKELPTKKEQMLDSLVRIKQQPQEIWMVKMADRISNLNAPPYYWDDFKKEKYRQEGQLIHDELNEGDDILAERLQMKINRYTKFIGSE